MPDVNEIIERLRRESLMRHGKPEGSVWIDTAIAAVREAAQPDEKMREGIGRITYCFDLAVGDDEFAIDKAGDDFIITITVPRERAEKAETCHEWEQIVSRALEAHKWQGKEARRAYWTSVRWAVLNA